MIRLVNTIETNCILGSEIHFNWLDGHCYMAHCLSPYGKLFVTRLFCGGSICVLFKKTKSCFAQMHQAKQKMAA